MTKVFPGRTFQFWEFSVSHGAMLVRSPRTEFVPNIDIMFWDVRYVDLPRDILPELELDDPNDMDIAFVQERLRTPVKSQDIVVLKVGGRRYRVVAGGIKVAESLMDNYDSPFPPEISHRGGPWLWVPRRTAIANLHWLTSEEGGFQHPPLGPVYTNLVSYEGQQIVHQQPREAFVVEFLKTPGGDLSHPVRVSFLLNNGPADILQSGQRFELLDGTRVVARGTVISSELPVSEDD